MLYLTTKIEKMCFLPNEPKSTFQMFLSVLRETWHIVGLVEMGVS